MAEASDPPPARRKSLGPMQRLVQPLRHAAAAFFKRDLALRREGSALHLVLEERPAAAPRRPSRAEQAQRKDGEELARMRAELAALLDELPDTRATMRHLVFVEHALARKGLRALLQVPLDVLQPPASRSLNMPSSGPERTARAPSNPSVPASAEPSAIHCSAGAAGT